MEIVTLDDHHGNGRDPLNEIIPLMIAVSVDVAIIVHVQELFDLMTFDVI